MNRPSASLKYTWSGVFLQEHVQQPALVERVGAVIAWRCAVVSHVKKIGWCRR